MNKTFIAAAVLGLFSFNVNALDMVGVESPRQHGNRICSIDLSLDANNPTVEPRGGQAMLIFYYDKAVDDSAFNYPQAATPSGGRTATVTSVDGKEVTVMLTGIVNQDYVKVYVEARDKATGLEFNTSEVTVGYLLGDVNQSRVVTVADKGLANADIGRALNCNQGNRRFRYDVNVDGVIDTLDTSVINSQITKALPQR